MTGRLCPVLISPGSNIPDSTPRLVTRHTVSSAPELSPVPSELMAPVRAVTRSGYRKMAVLVLSLVTSQPPPSRRDHQVRVLVPCLHQPTWTRSPDLDTVLLRPCREPRLAQRAK